MTTENKNICDKTLAREHDPMGAAIADYYATKGRTTGRLRVFEPMFEEDEIPLATLFRTYDEMPELERMALARAEGRVLDVGAGAGCHALWLQQQGLSVTAIDISQYAVETMQKRGVADAQTVDFWDVKEKYDTILMLMNGIGIIGKINRLPDFFRHIDTILADGGRVLMESTDIEYLFTDDDGLFVELPPGDYYGELNYTMQYKRIKGKPFPWVFVDQETLRAEAAKHNFLVNEIAADDECKYVAEIVRLR